MVAVPDESQPDQWQPSPGRGGGGGGGGGRHRKGRVTTMAVPESDPSTGPIAGPYDSGQPPLPPRLDAMPLLDLGSVRLPLPPDARLRPEVETTGALRAVHVLVPVGRLTVSAFAAPRAGGLWAELAEELVGILQADGATVRRDRGEWGRELVAKTGDTIARVIGVDGPRWMLRGVGTGPAGLSRHLHGLLRDMVRRTVVVRGENPLPVRTLLPLRLPEDLPVPVDPPMPPS